MQIADNKERSYRHKQEVICTRYKIYIITTAIVEWNSKLTRERSTLGTDGGGGIIDSDRESSDNEQKTNTGHKEQKKQEQEARIDITGSTLKGCDKDIK